jgi:CheY-like chemotaxis protein
MADISESDPVRRGRLENGEAAPAEQPTVLVVEDEILIRMVISDQLREAGCRVIETTNAAEGLAVLRSGGSVDVIVSDVRMPGSIDGLGLARLVRSEFPRTKIVLVSGHLRDVGAADHDGFFPKPYNLDRLIEHIRGLMG